LQTWAVGLGSVVRFAELTVLPPTSLPAEASEVTCVQVMFPLLPTVPDLTKKVALAPCGCRALW